MSSDGKSLTVLGTNNHSTPTIMEILTRDGSVTRFFSLEHSFADETNPPVYETFGAIYFDKDD